MAGDRDGRSVPGSAGQLEEFHQAGKASDAFALLSRLAGAGLALPDALARRLRAWAGEVFRSGAEADCDVLLSTIKKGRMIDFLDSVPDAFVRFRSIGEHGFLGNYLTHFTAEILPRLKGWLHADNGYVRYQAAFAVGHLRKEGLSVLEDLQAALRKASGFEEEENIRKAIERVSA